MSEQPTERPSRSGVWAVLLLVFAMYLPALGNGFAMDDNPIASSKWTRHYPRPDPTIAWAPNENLIRYLGKFFTRHYWYKESVNDGLYRPISVLSYGLVYQLIGRHVRHEAWPQHLVNVLLHTWATWLVLCLLLHFGAGRGAALLGALLFGVHAIHSEVVAGVVGRAEIFAFAFGAQATIWLLSERRSRHVLASLFFLLAFLSKESALAWVPFFFCFALARHWQRHHDADPWKPLRRGALETPLVVIGGAILIWFVLRWNTFRLDPPIDLVADFTSNPLVEQPVLTRWLTAIVVWGFALWLNFVPYPLSSLYGPLVFPMVETLGNAWFWLSAAALLGFLLAGLRFGRRLPALFLGMTCFLGFSFLTSNVPMPIGTILGERLYYIPSLGICLLPVALWGRIGDRGRRILLAVLAVWIAGNVAQAIHRTLLWRSSLAVFSHDVANYPRNLDLNRKVAMCLTTDGPDQDLDRAIALLEKTKRMDPNFRHAYRELATIYRKQKRWQQAIDEYRGALQTTYREPPGTESIAYKGIGECYLGMADTPGTTPAQHQRRVRQAITWFEKSLTVPNWGTSHRDAYYAILDKSEGLLPRDQLKAVLQRALQHKPPDTELAIAMARTAFLLQENPRLVYQLLDWAIKETPVAERNAAFWANYEFYARACIELGQVQKGKQILQMLLGRADIRPEQKAVLRDILATDPRLR